MMERYAEMEGVPYTAPNQCPVSGLRLAVPILRLSWLQARIAHNARPADRLRRLITDGRMPVHGGHGLLIRFEHEGATSSHDWEAKKRGPTHN